MELTAIDGAESVDLFELLEGVQKKKDIISAPYIRLRDYFRLREKSSVTLTFKEIENIMGDELNHHAYTDEGFWFDEMPDFIIEQYNVSRLKVPDKPMDQKFPDAAIHEAKTFLLT